MSQVLISFLATLVASLWPKFLSAVQHGQLALHLHLGPFRPQRWSIFQSDGMVNVFFSGHHWAQWFFDGFDNVGPSPLNVFLRAQPLVSMVFRWFSKFWGQWSTMVLRLTMVWMDRCGLKWMIQEETRLLYNSMQNDLWDEASLVCNCNARQ